jgi:hypothetical protein
VVSIDKETQTVTLADGGKITYDKLISTIPLDITLKWLGKPEWAGRLQHSSSHIIGIGIRGAWWVTGKNGVDSDASKCRTLSRSLGSIAAATAATPA